MPIIAPHIFDEQSINRDSLLLHEEKTLEMFVMHLNIAVEIFVRMLVLLPILLKLLFFLPAHHLSEVNL